VWIRDGRQLTSAYIRTWFFIDVLSILPYDDMSQYLFSELAQVRLIRIVRALRIAKLVRVFKASKIMKRWSQRVGLSSTHRYLGMFAILILAAIHWFACVWGFLGRLNNEDMLCRQDMNGTDHRFMEYPTSQYFFEDTTLRDPRDPDQWGGQSWWTSFVDVRLLNTATNPCDHITLYVISMYWAIMTLTSIGYGDVVPVTLVEFITCNCCMLASSILWAYIIGAACAVMSNMDPEQTQYEQRMDAFNAMAKDQHLPQDLRMRGREYVRAERYHAHCLSNKKATHHLGKNLRSTVCREWAARFLNDVWFMTQTTEDFRDHTADIMHPHFFESTSLIDLFGMLCVVERGAVGRKGRILVPLGYWGDDMLLRSKALQCQVPAVALSHCEIFTLSRDDLCRVILEYPEEADYFRRSAILVAIRRLVEIRQDLLSADYPDPDIDWVNKLFDGIAQRDFKPKKQLSRNHGNALRFGQEIPSADERREQLAADLRKVQHVQSLMYLGTHPQPVKKQSKPLPFSM